MHCISASLTGWLAGCFGRATKHWQRRATLRRSGRLVGRSVVSASVSLLLRAWSNALSQGCVCCRMSKYSLGPLTQEEKGDGNDDEQILFWEMNDVILPVRQWMSTARHNQELAENTIMTSQFICLSIYHQLQYVQQFQWGKKFRQALRKTSAPPAQRSVYFSETSACSVDTVQLTHFRPHSCTVRSSPLLPTSCVSGNNSELEEN